jgi:hypothetical protein
MLEPDEIPADEKNDDFISSSTLRLGRVNMNVSLNFTPNYQKLILRRKKMLRKMLLVGVA